MNFNLGKCFVTLALKLLLRIWDCGSLALGLQLGTFSLPRSLNNQLVINWRNSTSNNVGPLTVKSPNPAGCCLRHTFSLVTCRKESLTELGGVPRKFAFLYVCACCCKLIRNSDGRVRTRWPFVPPSRGKSFALHD